MRGTVLILDYLEETLVRWGSCRVVAAKDTIQFGWTVTPSQSLQRLFLILSRFHIYLFIQFLHQFPIIPLQFLNDSPKLSFLTSLLIYHVSQILHFM